MIGIIFEHIGEIVEVRVDGNNISFRSSTFGSQFFPLDRINFDRTGVIKEFPDLANAEDWKSQALIRFKDKMKAMGNDNERANYIIEDLKKYGYIPKFIQKQGHRVEVIDAN